MRIKDLTGNNGYIEEHVKGGLDSYYQLTKAKSLAKADGHDYDKLPEYHRGADQPHKEKYKALAKEVKEAKGLGKRVKVVKGHFAGEEGTIREIKHGAFKGAPKSYYIDLDNGEMADNLPADVLRLIKRTDEKEKMLTLKDIDNGGKKDVKLTFKRKPDGTPIDKKQPQKEVKEVSDFKKRELEYELRDEEPKSVPSKRRPYRTPQEKIRDAKKRYSKAVGVMKGNTDEGIEEAEGDKCEICNGRGKIDYHSEDGPSKCQKCNGKGVQAWKPEPVNWGKVKEDSVEKDVIGHVDNEADMLRKELFKMGKYSVELYKMLDQLPEGDFPHWWQAKIVKAGEYLSSAKHYLDGELNSPEEESPLDTDQEQELHVINPSGV